MSSATALDHVGVVGRDLGALAQEYERIGFCLTPLARHAGGRTGNRCVMLRQGYIELLAVVDGGSSTTLERFLARYAGIHILALAMVNENDELRRLHRAGVVEVAVSQTDRAVDDADPTGARARFTLLTAPDLPEGRVHLVRHDTPEALWQERFLQHPNHATSLSEVVMAVMHPAETAVRLSLRAGRPMVPDRTGGYALKLSRGALRIVPSDVLGGIFPHAVAPVLPWIAGLTLRTDDANIALRRLLQDRMIPFCTDGDALTVQAGGAALRFIPH